jgi:hypothetical protein
VSIVNTNIAEEYIDEFAYIASNGRDHLQKNCSDPLESF